MSNDELINAIELMFEDKYSTIHLIKNAAKECINEIESHTLKLKL